MTKFFRIVLISSVSTLLLAGCGIKGELQSPPPLWGEKAKEYKQEQARKEAEQAKNEAARQNQ